MALSPQWLDELRSRVTLSSVVMRTTKLQRAGREWKACCPFHNEKTPSFTVNDQKGFYHCFGCQAHGDVISWMTDQRGLSFMDAVKELASEAGLEVPQPDPHEAHRAEQRAGLHDVMKSAQDWFMHNLHAATGAEARDYLSKRGLNARTIERFGFGWAPDDRGGLKKALSHFDESMLVEAGLLISVDDRQPYDRFRGRVTLPIQDTRERVIAFGGRILHDREGAPKYLNSPDTPLFDKGRTLYNIHRAGPACRKSNRVVVVEGYMDVVALGAAGIEDSVAPMGTALTERQVELLWRLADKSVLCFDGDGAGRRAAMKAVERTLPLLRPGHSLQIVTLPAGIDPDDLVRKSGAGAMEDLLAAPRTMLDLMWEHERDARALTAPEDKAGLKERLLAHVDAIQHPDIRSLYRRELMDRYSAFAFPKRDFQTRASSAGARPRTSPRLPASPELNDRLRKAASGASRDMLTSAALAGLGRYPDQIDRHAEKLLRLATSVPQVAPAIDYLLEAAETLEAGENSPIFAAGTLPPPPDNARFSFLLEGSDPDDAREDLAEAVALLVERPELEAAIVAATARFDIDPEGAFAEQQRLRKRKLEIEVRLGHMARKRAAATEARQEQSATGEFDTRGEQATD